jgi:hypothetical protein
MRRRAFVHREVGSRVSGASITTYRNHEYVMS